MSNNTLDEHSSQIPALYPEIIEDILRHLESDKAALMACALVSRTWVYTTRRHLFRNLQIREAQPDLVPFLANTPTISRHIQELRLGHSSPVVKSRHRLNTTTIRDILRNLPALTSLTLDGGFWEVGDFGVDSDSFADTRFRTFTQLQSLTLTRVLIGGAVHAGIEGLRYNLHRLLVLFPCLRRISLLQTWVGDDWHLNELTNDLLSPLNLDLEFLVIHTTQSTASLLNFFQVSHCTRSLRRLDITCPEPTHLSPFREFISEVGSHITHLRLDLTCAIEWVVDENIPFDNVDLSPCTSLKTLHLHIGLGESVSWHDLWYWNAVAHTLSTTTTSLQNLIFGIFVSPRAYSLKSFKSVDWMRVDDALSRFLVLKNFVILSQESVRHVPGSTASNLHEDLKDAFPPRFPSIPAEIIRWSPDEVEEGVMVS